MDTQSPRQNEEILHSFIEQEDPHIAGLVGLDALQVLAREMPTEKFKQFLQQSIQDAAQLKQSIVPEQEPVAAAPEPAPAANPEEGS